MDNYSFILITDNEEFSLTIKKYFIEKSKIKKENIDFLCFGTDKQDKEFIIKSFKSTRFAKTRENIKFVIFSDLGDSFKIAKQIKEELDDEIYISNSSIIESGYIVFLLLNSYAPFESIKKFIDYPTPKNEL